MRRLAVALVLLGACAGRGPQRLGQAPSWRRSDGHARASGPVTFAPASEPAARYNEAQPSVPHTALNDAVTAAVRDAAARANLPAPQPDPRLFRACAELAEVVPEEGVIGYSLVEFALQHNGIIEPSPHLLVVWGDISSPELIVKELQPRLVEVLSEGANARLGIGTAQRNPDGTGSVVFALQGSGVQTLPIPRMIERGGNVAIDAIVDPRYHDPEVFVTYQSGDTRRLELKPGRPGGFVAQLACGSRHGRQQIEITASDAAGSTVLANFPVWCAAQPPLSVTIDPTNEDTPAASPEQAEHRLLASVNRDRMAAGLPSLLWNDSLAAVARGYSDEMSRTRVVAHISPTSGSAADRVRTAGIKTAVVLENVARAYGVHEAHQALMNSPGHRANLMSAVATHIGIGVALGEEVPGRREMFITQVFMRVPPKIDHGRAVATVRQKFVAARPKLVDVAGLDGLAQQLADGLAAGKSAEVAYQAISGQIGGLGKSYQRVGSVITAVADLDTVDGAGLLAGSAAGEIGLGIAQGPHPQIGDNAIWIVVLLADRRKL
jgi:uncharacterized protein YkwD